jgi:hypothetical protein
MWDQDGDEVTGGYRGFTQGHTRDGTAVPIVQLELANSETVSVWMFNEALRARFADEVRSRPDKDLDPGERVTIRRGDKRQSTSNPDRQYRAFEVTFGNSRQPSALDLLVAGVPLGATAPPPMGEDIPF